MIYSRFFTFLFLFLSANPALFSQQLSTTKVATLPEPVSNNAVCEGFISGTPYLFSFGGIDSSKQFSGIHLRSFRCNLEAETCKTIAPLPDTVGKIAAGASRIGDIIYIMGGYHVFADGSEVSSKRVHRYQISTNSYLTDGNPIPVPIDDHVQAVWRDSLIYLVTGWSNVDNVPDVQIYNPKEDKWLTGTSVPNNQFYTAFGASGTFIEDTLYYFGGALSGITFPISRDLRRGVVSPNDPTQINWISRIPDFNVKGYRMASLSVFGKPVWLGGSEITYNYNGIAYDGSGGVSLSNQHLTIDNFDAEWQKELVDELPMDLRGAAKTSDSIAYLAGGMLTDQQVTDAVYKLEWQTVVSSNMPIVTDPYISFTVFPNPTSDQVSIYWWSEDDCLLEIFDMRGALVHAKTHEYNASIDVSNWQSGTYNVRLSAVDDRRKAQIKQLIIH